MTASTLPADLPSVAQAPLPATYTSAKAALAECSRIDECAEWADKAAAMASYAKQADDTSLYDMAVRIRARAIQRCGELLRAIEPGKPGRPADRDPQPGNGSAPNQISRSEAARRAGLSPHQKNTALRIAAIPEAEFEAAVEAPTPPTITQLAKQGTRPAARDHLDGRDPQEFEASTRAQGALRRLADVAVAVPAAVVVRGAYAHERDGLRRSARAVRTWLDDLLTHVEA